MSPVLQARSKPLNFITNQTFYLFIFFSPKEKELKRAQSELKTRSEALEDELRKQQDEYDVLMEDYDYIYQGKDIANSAHARIYHVLELLAYTPNERMGGLPDDSWE